MATWQQTITTVGRQAFLSSAALTFTKIQVGDGSLPAGATLESLTTLVHEVMEFDVNSVSRADNQITVKASFSNAQLATAFVYREIGLFATDGTTERLMFVGNCGDTAETIPAVTDGSVTRSVKIGINCASASSITITVQPETYLSADGDGSLLTVPFSEPQTATIDTLASGATTQTLIGAIKRLIRNQGTAIDSKAATVHTHAIADVTNLQTAIDGKAASVHTHAIADVANLQTSLDGKAATVHTHPASAVTAGTLSGAVLANATAQETLSDAQVRNIYAGTADMTAGTSSLATGTVYLVYE